IEATTDAVLREHVVEPGQHLVARHRHAVERNRFAMLEAQRHAQWIDRPFRALFAPASRAFARRLPAVDLAAGHREPEQVLVDRVGLLLCAHAETALFEIRLLVSADL